MNILRYSVISLQIIISQQFSSSETKMLRSFERSDIAKMMRIMPSLSHPSDPGERQITSRSFELSVRVHTHIAMSNDDDKGYVQFYKASRVLFVKKSRWNRLHPLTSRSRAQPTLLFTREHAQVCIHACTSLALLYQTL